MLEWMHDPSVVKDLRTDFASKTEEDCRRFIEYSFNDKRNIHRAIVNDEDEYLGTVSLKNVSNKSAEFAITIRAAAMGTGVSRAAMKEILELGFRENFLDLIYWCVSPENKRAVRFYDKNGYERVNPEQLPIGEEYSKEQVESYLWYSMHS